MVYRLRFLSRKTCFFDCFLSDFLDVDFFDVEKLDCLNRCFSCFLSDFFDVVFLYLKNIVVFSLFFM